MLAMRRSFMCRSASVVAIALMAAPALANPEGGVVTAGEATISTPAANLLQINQQSQRAVIDWKRFDIAPGETTRFVQPDVEAWTLNRVSPTGDPSRILGTLEANGNIVIVNPDGVHFGPGSRVDVNRLIATTADIDNDDFLAGRMIFDTPGNPSASIVNEGTISIRDHGLAALVAPGVRNSGVIAARLGTVSLSAGNTFTIDPYGDGLVKLAIDDEIAENVYDAATGEPMDDLVDNEGTVKADGGTVMMSAATARKAVNSVINNSGVVEANSVGMLGGKIVLGAQTAGTKTAAAPPQTVRVSGQVRATTKIDLADLPLPSPAPRGHIEITGEAIIAEKAEIDASGIHGGGTVLIGGDYMGGNPDPAVVRHYGIPMEGHSVPTAAYTFLGDDVSVRADAVRDGDGGKIIVWADEVTQTAATLSARGGPEGGHGGFIETSGKVLQVAGTVDPSAPAGGGGTWLLDPLDITIDRLSAANTDWTPSVQDIPFAQGGFWRAIAVTPTAQGSVVPADFIELALNSGNNVAISTFGTSGPERGDIRLKTDIRKSSGGSARFGLFADDDIFIDDGVDVRSTSGRLDFELFARGDDIRAEEFGRLQLNGGRLFLQAADDIRFKTGSNIPSEVVLVMRNSAKGSSTTGRVDVQFDDDIVEFRYGGRDAVFRQDAVKLTDRSGPGGVTLNFDEPVTGEFYDNAVTVDVNNGKFFNNGLSALGVNPSARLNGVPELITNGTPPEFANQLASLGDNGPPIVEWFEFYAGRTLASIGEVSTSLDQEVDFYVVTDRAGRDAVVRELAPPPPPTPEAIEIAEGYGNNMCSYSELMCQASEDLVLLWSESENEHLADVNDEGNTSQNNVYVDFEHAQALAEISNPRLIREKSGPYVVTAFFDDSSYEMNDNIRRTHLGLDIDTQMGETITSPISGTVLENSCYGSCTVYESYVIIRGRYADHVLIHADFSSLKEGVAVAAGDDLGLAHSSHVHWGVNVHADGLNSQRLDGWGLGQAPIGVVPDDIRARGWVDPLGGVDQDVFKENPFLELDMGILGPAMYIDVSP